MRFIVDMEEDGDVTAETVRRNIEEALVNWRANVGFSAWDDDGQINSISVTWAPEGEG